MGSACGSERTLPSRPGATHFVILVWWRTRVQLVHVRLQVHLVRRRNCAGYTLIERALPFWLTNGCPVLASWCHVVFNGQFRISNILSSIWSSVFAMLQLQNSQFHFYSFYVLLLFVLCLVEELIFTTFVFSFPYWFSMSDIFGNNFQDLFFGISSSDAR